MLASALEPFLLTMATVVDMVDLVEVATVAVVLVVVVEADTLAAVVDMEVVAVVVTA